MLINATLKASLCHRLNRAHSYVYSAKTWIDKDDTSTAVMRIDRAIEILTEVRKKCLPKSGHSFSH